MKKYIIILFLSILFLPTFSFAETGSTFKLDYSGLVKCDGVIDKSETDRQNKCDFNALMSMVKSTINWLFFITVPIATALLAYGGLLYMSGSQKNIGTARAIFSSVAKGFIIMLIAWVSVITVVNWFITDQNKEVIKTFLNI